jgi:hypothetical protein
MRYFLNCNNFFNDMRNPCSFLDSELRVVVNKKTWFQQASGPTTTHTTGTASGRGVNSWFKLDNSNAVIYVKPVAVIIG